MDENGTFMMGEEGVKRRYIFDYIPDPNDALRLADAINHVSPLFPEFFELTFRHRGRATLYYCTLYKLETKYFLKAWEIKNNKIIYLPWV